VGAACGVVVGFWAMASCEWAAISIKIAPQNARRTVIGVMCVMNVFFFLGKRVWETVCDIDLHISEWRVAVELVCVTGSNGS
jgi:hypothetical protein